MVLGKDRGTNKTEGQAFCLVLVLCLCEQDRRPVPVSCYMAEKYAARTSAEGPSAAIVPWSSTMTRSATAAATAGS
ncbi:hypothetical protein AGMMS49983_20090 [Clostridia bacterium]|nr:hypothetical protein AGMMS49983_20090 [Clostridia bacterium]